MSSYNKVILMGNLTRKPELRYLPNGTAVADFGLAVNDRYKDKDGEWQEKATFVDIEVWKRQAENCEKYLDKGSAVLVEGSLKLDQWETGDGQKRSKLKVTGMNVQFLGGGKPREKPREKPMDTGVEDEMPF